MTKKNNRFKGHNNHRRKSRLRPPYFINKNLQFDIVRKQMKMKTDGPTLNEISSIDSTGNVGSEDMSRSVVERPVRTSSKIKSWWEEYGKEIIIGIVVAIVVIFVGDLIIEHGKHLVKHDKDIEVIQKNDDKQDESLEKLKDKTNELKTDVRLLEQRMELTSGKNETSKPANKK